LLRGKRASTCRATAGIDVDQFISHSRKTAGQSIEIDALCYYPNGDDSFRAVWTPPDRCGQGAHLSFEINKGSVPATSLEIAQQRIEL
jgi:hypothetical protein